MSEVKDVSGFGWTIIFLSWLVASIATLGSLFFSEVMHFPPCIMCWYQRILMYPLVIVLLMGLFPFDAKVIRYAMPLALVGWCFALYHNLLMFGIIPESATPCSQGISCSSAYIKLLGFITIPMMSFMAFSTILALLFILKRRLSK